MFCIHAKSKLLADPVLSV